MILEPKPLEEWVPADFVRYITDKLKSRGIDYQVKNPVDYIAVGRLIKNFRLADRTKFSLKTEIDNVFDTKTFSYVNSLSFLWGLIKMDQNIPREKRYKQESIVLSDPLKNKLKKLKEEINEPRPTV